MPLHSALSPSLFSLLSVSSATIIWENSQLLTRGARASTFCATVDGNVVGSVMGTVCDELYGNCRPFLLMEDLIVDKAYREQGIGKALMAELEDYAAEHGCSQIQFITERDREDAIAFYASLGFDTRKHIGFKQTLVAIKESD